MNRIGGGPSITFLVIGLLAFVAIITLAVQANNQFITDNTILNQSDSSIQDDALGNLSSQQTALQNQIGGVTGTALSLPQLTSAIFTTAVIGLQSIITLTTLPLIINSIFDTIGNGLGMGGPAILILKTFLISVVAIYVINKIIQSVRGTSQET